MTVLLTFICSLITMTLFDQVEKIKTAGLRPVTVRSLVSKELLQMIRENSLKTWLFSVCFTIIAATVCLRLYFRDVTVSLGFRFMAVTVIFTIAAITDFKEKIIPNKLVIAGLITRVLFIGLDFLSYGAETPRKLLFALITGVITLVILLLFAILSKGGFGMGDVKLVSVVALFISGVNVLYMMLLGMLICAVYAIFLLATKKKGLKDHIPFAPFLYAGYIVTVLLGLF